MNNQTETLNDWTFKGVSITDPLGETGPTVENYTDFKPGDYIVYKDAEYRYILCEDGVTRWIKIDLTAPVDLNDMVYYVGQSTTDPEKAAGPTVIGFTIFHAGAIVEYEGTEYIFDGENWKKIIIEEPEVEITNSSKSKDVDSIMGCEDCCDCPSERSENWPVIEDMITDDLFPEEASVKIGHNKWCRESELKEISRVNESNKAIVDKCLAEYKEKHPERCKDKTDIPFSDYDILLRNDDIWDEWLLYDMLVANSLRNNDFVIANWPEDGFRRGNEEKEKLHDIVRQFDVIFDVSLGGYVCQPYIVFNVCEKTTWMADQKTDNYACKELSKINKKYKSEEWYPEGTKEYSAREIELYKEGHIKFDIRKLNPEYLQCVRKVTHKEKHKGVSHDIW